MSHFDLISLPENRSFNYQIDMPSGTYTKRGLITSKHDYHKTANKNKGYSDFYTKTLNKNCQLDSFLKSSVCLNIRGSSFA